jgi:hypothetical protein|tara:strand:- start:625 stop:825 length:201 start_codon:yes stop_codon:yes gene_type:complete
MEKKKVIKKAVKKPVKVELKDKLTEIAEFIDTTIREERNKELSTVACARLGKVKQDLMFIARNIIN